MALDPTTIKNMADQAARLKETMGEITDQHEKQKLATEKQVELYKELRNFGQIDQTQRAGWLDEEEKRIKKLEKRGSLRGEELAQAEEILNLKRSMVDMSADDLRLAVEMIKKGNERLKQLEKERELYKQNKSDLATIASRMGSILGIGERFSGTLTGGLVTMGKLGVEVGKDVGKFEDWNVLFGKGLLEAADLALGAFIAMSEEVMFLQDQLTTGFVKSAGASKKYQDSLYEASERLRGLGLNMDSAAEAQVQLFDKVTAFKDASPAARREIATFSGILLELGIDADSSTESLQLLTLGLGQTLPQAAKTTEGIIRFARSIDMNLNQAMTDFNELAPELIKYGDNMEEVFRGLMKISRRTGIEMSKLFDAASQYDTFEDAATSVGRLNGILGGPYFNSIQMLYATEEQRLQLLKEGFEASGRQFKDLSRFEKQSVATQAGFASVAEAMMFFNQEAMDPAAREAMENQKALADMAREAKPAMEKLQLAMMRLAVSFKPAIEGVTALIEGFNKLPQGMGPVIASMAAVTGLLISGSFMFVSQFLLVPAILIGLIFHTEQFVGWLKQAGYWVDMILLMMMRMALATPFGWIGAAIAGVTLLIRHWDRLGNLLTGKGWTSPTAESGPNTTWGEGITSMQSGKQNFEGGNARTHSGEVGFLPTATTMVSAPKAAAALAKGFQEHTPPPKAALSDSDLKKISAAVRDGLIEGTDRVSKNGNIKSQPIEITSNLRIGKDQISKTVKEILREEQSVRFVPGT